VLVLSVAVLGLSGSVARAQDSYAEDRAKIEDLQARYMFALDFGDAETYAATFAEDGVLDFGMGETGLVAKQAQVAGPLSSAGAS